MCTSVFLTSVFTMAKPWKPPEWASTDGCGASYVRGTGRGLKRNEVLPFATAWMELEGIMLRAVKSDGERHVLVISNTWNLKK